MATSHGVIVTVEASGLKYEWDVGTDKDLSYLGILNSDIQRIESDFFAVPGHLYTEPGVASPYHPTAGSCGAAVFTLDGRQFQIQDILYHDRGHRGGSGPPHWNHERRYVEVFSNGTQIEIEITKDVEDHTIPDTNKIKWALSPGVSSSEDKRDIYRPNYP